MRLKMASPNSAIEKEDERLFNTLQKWYVRKLWLKYCIERKDRNNQNFIRMLTLTCTQIYEVKLLLDNRLLVLTDSGAFDPRCLAFCEMRDHRFALIQKVLPGARYFKGRFEDLVGAGRVGYSNKVDSWFPFDVVNLDINGCIFGGDSRVLDAIRKLFMIQKIRSKSFTLFLTVCSIQEGDDEESISELRKFLHKNLDDPEIHSKFHEKYPNGAIHEYHEFQSIAVPKKILECGLSEGFDVVCSEKLSYIGEGPTTRMVSLVFECEYLGSTELATLAARRRERILEILDQECKNVNLILEQNEKDLVEAKELKSRYSA